MFRKDALQNQEGGIGREETGGRTPVSARTDASQREGNGEGGEKAMRFSTPAGPEGHAWARVDSEGEQGHGRFQAQVTRRLKTALCLHRVLTLCQMLF